MNAPHSPAPWKWRGSYLIDANGNEVAAAVLFRGTIAQDDANRRLIERAPEVTAALAQVAARLETVLRYNGATDAQIQTHPDLCLARSVARRLAGETVEGLTDE